MEVSEKDRKRFLSRLEEDPATGCILWTASLDARGYGQCFVGGKVSKAHRIAWLLAGNEITPDKPCILHKCDNPACCNVEHLWAGTQVENIADMVAKGRGHRSKIGLPRGVQPCASGGRYYARIWAHGKDHYLGTFPTAEKASEAVEHFRLSHSEALSSPL